MNGAVLGDVRRKAELHAERLELHGDHRRDGAARGGGRQDGKGKFAAGHEAGFLAVHRDQVGLGQHLQQIARLQGADGGADVEIRPEDEQVQKSGLLPL